jgi:hypothetical protein
MSTAAARQRRHRARLKAGRRLYAVEADELDVEELLAETGCASLGEVIELLLSVTRNDMLSEIVLECLQTQRSTREGNAETFDR